MKFNEYIKNIRKEHSLTQSQLAEILNISLAAIKKIESGKTEFPSSKVLEKLAVFMNRNQVEIMQDLLFNKEDFEICENQQQIETLDLLQRYVSLMFLDGWNLSEYLQKKKMESIQDEIFGAELSSKRTPSYKIVIDTAYKYTLDMLDVNERDDNKALLSMLLVTVTQMKDKIKEYCILFDANDEYETNFYKNVLNICIRNIKVKIKFILFNKITCEIIDEKEVCQPLDKELERIEKALKSVAKEFIESNKNEE